MCEGVKRLVSPSVVQGYHKNRQILRLGIRVSGSTLRMLETANNGLLFASKHVKRS